MDYKLNRKKTILRTIIFNNHILSYLSYYGKKSVHKNIRVRPCLPIAFIIKSGFQKRFYSDSALHNRIFYVYEQIFSSKFFIRAKPGILLVLNIQETCYNLESIFLSRTFPKSFELWNRFFLLSIFTYCNFYSFKITYK